MNYKYDFKPAKYFFSSKHLRRGWVNSIFGRKGGGDYDKLSKLVNFLSGVGCVQRSVALLYHGVRSIRFFLEEYFSHTFQPTLKYTVINYTLTTPKRMNDKAFINDIKGLILRSLLTPLTTQFSQKRVQFLKDKFELGGTNIIILKSAF